ncbi:MAG: isoprenylcysteine carboxylmethyltransferase family protein [Abditibacteriaceae bacterium]
MDSPTTQTPQIGGKGVLGKPLIEKLKLLFVFICLGVIIWFSNPTLPYFIGGLALVVIGTLIRIWAGGHLTRDQKLTTSGPYAYSRNPFYLGRLLWIIGFAIMAGFPTGYATYVIYGILLVALIIFFVLYMPRKEAREGGRLKTFFGEDYETWKTNVPSLFPRLTPYVMNPKPWNSKLYFGNDGAIGGNKEIWTTLAVVVIAVLFFLRMIWHR